MGKLKDHYLRIEEQLDEAMRDEPPPICDECGEPAHLFGCSKPPFITAPRWRRMSDGARLDAECDAASRGYVFVDGAGWRMP